MKIALFIIINNLKAKMSKIFDSETHGKIKGFYL